MKSYKKDRDKIYENDQILCKHDLLEHVRKPKGVDRFLS